MWAGVAKRPPVVNMESLQLRADMEGWHKPDVRYRLSTARHPRAFACSGQSRVGRHCNPAWGGRVCGHGWRGAACVAADRHSANATANAAGTRCTGTHGGTPPPESHNVRARREPPLVVVQTTAPAAGYPLAHARPEARGGQTFRERPQYRSLAAARCRQLTIERPVWPGRGQNRR